MPTAAVAMSVTPTPSLTSEDQVGYLLWVVRFYVAYI